MEKSALLAALAAGDALPFDELRVVSFDGASSEPAYRRAIDVLLALDVVSDYETVGATSDRTFETFKAAGLEFSGPVGVLAMREAIEANTAPLEKLASETIEVVVDGIRATIAGPVAQSLAEHVRAASSRALAPVAVADDGNVVSLAARRQETGGESA